MRHGITRDLIKDTLNSRPMAFSWSKSQRVRFY